MTTSGKKKSKACSISERPSPQWTINPATPIVMAAGTAAHRVLNPIKIKIGAMNSPSTVSIKDGVSPMPIKL